MRIRHCLLATTLVLACDVSLAAQVTPLGDEMSVSAPETGREHQPAIAFQRDGSLVVWADEQRGALGRRFGTLGVPLGGAFVLAANDPLPPVPFTDVVIREAHEPAVATRRDGGFLAVWTDQRVNRSADIFFEQQFVVSSRVVARVFQADGTPSPRTWPLSAVDAVASRPSVVLTAGDTFLVSWQERGGKSPGIHLRRVDRRRGPAGRDVLVGARGQHPSLAVAGRSVLVAWDRCCGSNAGAQVFARLFDLSGNPAGEAFKIAGDGPHASRAASVAGQPGGDFLIVYQQAVGEDPLRVRIYGQIVSGLALPVGGVVPLSEGSAGLAHTEPEVAPLANGGWVVSWMTWFNAWSRGAITAAGYSPLGNHDSSFFELNADRGLILGLELALATASDGRVLAAWEGVDAQGRRGLRARAALGPGG